MPVESEMKIITGRANPALAHAIADRIGIALTPTKITNFKDEEIYAEIQDNVRGQDLFIVQPTHKPANDNLMELLILIDAARRGSAKRITVVLPYFGYARQDRKTAPRAPITAKLVANLITHSGADRVATMDLHAGQIQGFFDIPCDNLQAAPVFAQHISTNPLIHPERRLVISPDVGGVVRARSLAQKLDDNQELAIIDKRRPRAGVSEVMNVIGTVEGRECILVDDIVDSAGTLCNAAEALIKHGAKSVCAYCTHGVLSEPALQRLTDSPMTKLYITDSIAATPEVAAHDKVEQIPIANLFAEAILRIRDNESVSYLFEQGWLKDNRLL